MFELTDPVVHHAEPPSDSDAERGFRCYGRTDKGEASLLCVLGVCLCKGFPSPRTRKSTELNLVRATSLRCVKVCHNTLGCVETSTLGRKPDPQPSTLNSCNRDRDRILFTVSHH